MAGYSADDFEEIAEYGQEKEHFFRQFLELRNGIASHSGCDKKIAKLIRENEGDYLLALKKNQKGL